ncbi:BppU family phage baseplate upper protein [Staphylococcus lugdunensis]|uniref:BppU family phage baseplate upper protein n=1 Tax=Staphylococcus lugdunensis TaxID=28035 RepID=UPI001F4CB84A|nr:BppU family phage baseplate upper protein [Staphylococcus lugdunensis]MCH8678357.1 BppU family phage baseplate upper protein [Staphylococcus lugdunensis]
MSDFSKDGIYKEAKLIALDEPRLVPITNEQLVFYNLDINTAMLTFQLKKGIYPLQISKTNADIHVFFESTNGSQTDKVNVEFVDSLNGVIRFVVDNEFLSTATDTWVTGQIYLTAVGRADTVVLNEFQFYVKDALINKIGADIKIKTIRQIDQLVMDVRKKVDNEMKSLTKLKDIRIEFDAFVIKSKNDLNKTINDTKSDINNLKDTAEKSINSQIERIRNESDEVIKKINAGDVVDHSDLDNALATYVKNSDFKTELDKKANTSDITEPSALEKMISDKIDERLAKVATPHVFTDENGYIPRIENPDLDSMSGIDKSGFFYAYAPVNSPDTENDNGYLVVIARSASYKKVLFMPFNKHTIYSRNKLGTTTGWGKWKNVTSQYSN